MPLLKNHFLFLELIHREIKKLLVDGYATISLLLCNFELAFKEGITKKKKLFNFRGQDQSDSGLRLGRRKVFFIGVPSRGRTSAVHTPEQVEKNKSKQVQRQQEGLKRAFTPFLLVSVMQMDSNSCLMEDIFL